MKKRESITQEHGTGCAVACTAFILNLSYRAALKHFSKPAHAWGRGFYGREVVAALKNSGREYSHCYVKSNRRGLLTVPGAIVFIARSSRYPSGHYLVRTRRGDWMNPWINFPVIAPAKSAFEKRLPGRPTYVIYPIAEVA